MLGAYALASLPMLIKDSQDFFEAVDAAPWPEGTTCVSHGTVRCTNYPTGDERPPRSALLVRATWPVISCRAYLTLDSSDRPVPRIGGRTAWRARHSVIGEVWGEMLPPQGRDFDDERREHDRLHPSGDVNWEVDLPYDSDVFFYEDPGKVRGKRSLKDHSVMRPLPGSTYAPFDTPSEALEDAMGAMRRCVATARGLDKGQLASDARKRALKDLRSQNRRTRMRLKKAGKPY